MPWRGAFNSGYWKISEGEKTINEIRDLIPPEASVETLGAIAPHLTHRQTLYAMGSPRVGGFVDTDYIVVCRYVYSDRLPYSDLEKYLNEKEKTAYRKVFDQNGWIVLKNKNYSAGLEKH